MRVRIKIGERQVTATLDDNATARDLGALLPLTVTLEDHAATEKVAYLPRKLSTVDAPVGSDPEAGDVAYYAPWGNLALFHRDFGYSPGLVRLGRIEAGLDALRAPGKQAATIELDPN